MYDFHDEKTEAEREQERRDDELFHEIVALSVLAMIMSLVIVPVLIYMLYMGGQ